MAIETAVILAAGEGTRFWPYNVVRNKVAFPIANVPAIRRLVDDLATLGILRCVVVVGYREPSVRAALRGALPEIRYARQSAPEGTATATLLAAHSLDEDLIVVHGDVVTARDNLRAILECYREVRPLAAAAIQPLAKESPQDWIIAHAAGDRLTRVEGHPRGGTHRLCGIYVFGPRALPYLRDNPGIMTNVPVGGMPPVDAEIAESLQVMIDEGETVLSVAVLGYHVDLDKPWHILQANACVVGLMSTEACEDEIPASASVSDGAEIRGHVFLGEDAIIGDRVVVGGHLWLGRGARVENGAILEGSAVIGPGTVVKNYCQIGAQSSLGARGVYGHGAEFSGVALNKVYCYHYCEVWGVAGQAVDFGAATVCGNLRFDDADTMWSVKGRPETPSHAANAAYFGDFCRTGVNATVMPGRRIGVYACLGPGVVAYEDVPDRQMLLVKQQLDTSPWGPERYGW